MRGDGEFWEEDENVVRCEGREIYGRDERRFAEKMKMW